MRTVKEVILKQHTLIMRQNGIEGESREDMEIGAASGLDSLGIVDFLIGIEEELNVELDDCLAGIRECKNMGELIQLIENYIN